MHPDKKRFTYREISRLDKFLVSEAFTNYVQNSDILHAGIYSDHKCIKIDINFSSSIEALADGSSILNDNTYIENIKKKTY